MGISDHLAFPRGSGAPADRPHSGAAGGSGGDAGPAQAVLRPILARHLADDLATEEVMLRAFRGVVPEDEVDGDG